MPRNAIRLRRFICFAVALGGMAALTACGPADEFKTPPQAGAWNRGIYPSFNQRPQAETAQFSAADQARLTGQLRSAGKQVSGMSPGEDKAAAAQPGQSAPASAQQQADKAIQDTLRQIQNSGK